MIAIDQDTLTEQEFQLISDLVYRHCGINLHDGKKELVRARLAKLVRSSGAASVSEYLAQVRADASGREFATLIDAISTNLTSFFREKTHFEYLKDKFLPSIASAQRHGTRCRVRAWSAGCSSGEEAYSLAITLLEAAGGGPAWDAKLLATDISRPVLQKARTGIYDKSRLASVAPELRSQYFTPTNLQNQPAFAVSDALRRVVQFNYLNLMDTWPFSGPFDFIFCRNVMIYFDKKTQENLVNRFWQCLRPGGMLFTGHSESLTGVSHKFSYVLPTVYEK